MYGVHNYLNDNNDGTIEAIDKSKWQVIGSGINHDGPSPTFTGPHLVENIADEAAVIPFPTFSPAAGTYSSSQMVTITSVPGASIYYVIGPQGYQSQSVEYQLKTGKWIPYTGPVAVTQNRKLIAVAVKDGQYSRPRCAYYYINPNAGQQASTPTFTPAPGTYTTAQTVTLRTATSGAQIRYTIDGSTPTSTTGILIPSSSGTINISSTSTIRAIAFGTGLQNSTIAMGAYTINAAVQASAPTLTPAPGTYTIAQTVTLRTTTSGAQIRYTLDGSTPTSTTGILIPSNSGTVSINSTSTIRAVAFGSGLQNSTIASGAYTITPSNVQGPYSGSPIIIPGIVEAENFDTGGEGIAYHDMETANQGSAYRTTEGVDIETCTEGGFNVGWIQNGEWLEYTVNVQTSGTYSLEARVASPSGGGVFEVLFSNGSITSGDITVPATGGWQTWLSVSKAGLSLNAGTQTLRINLKSAGFNLNQIRVVAGDGQAPTTPGGLISSNLTETGFSLSWNASTDNVGVIGYNVYRNNSLIGSSTSSSFNVTGLAAGTTHSMTVAARDAAGNLSALSLPLSVTTLPASQTGYRYLRYTVLSTNGNYKVTELDWLVGTSQHPSENLTSNNSNAMVVSGSAGDLSFRAFDGLTTDANGLWVGTQIPFRITLDLGNNPINPTGIRIQKSSWHGLNSFRCEGSNNNTTWTTLFESNTAQGTWTDQTFNFSSGGATSRMTQESLDREQSGLIVFPNPASEVLSFHYNSSQDKNIAVSLMEIGSTRKVISENHAVKAGDNLISLEVSELASGIYLLQTDGMYKKVVIEK